VSRNALGLAGNVDSYSASISADGRFVAFGSYASDLVPGTGFDFACPCSRTSTPGYSYVADMASGTIALVTYDGTGWLDGYDSTEPEISADGRWIVVTSEATTLVPDDTNLATDVFRFENPLWEATP
jgi:Tol biopolymer transport system component